MTTTDLRYGADITFVRPRASKMMEQTNALVIDTGPINDYDVSGIGFLRVLGIPGPLVMNGLSGGVAGQELDVFCYGSIAFNHLNGAGTQQFILSTGAPKGINFTQWGTRFVFDGTYWREVAK